MASENVKLLGARPSPYVIRARVALNIKSIEYEFLEETFGVKSELLLKSNPVYKKIPVLIHGDKPICESLIIVHYIDEAWTSGPTILPSDPHERAVARFWAAYIDDTWYPLARALLIVEDDEAKNAALEKAKPGLKLLEEAFINCSKGQKFFGGDKIGYLDIALGSYLGWIRIIQKMANVNIIDEPLTPNLFKWSQDFSADAAVKDVLPEADEMVGIAKFVIAKMKAPAN